MWPSMNSEKTKKVAFTDDVKDFESDGGPGHHQLWDSGFLSGGNITGQFEEQQRQQQQQQQQQPTNSSSSYFSPLSSSSSPNIISDNNNCEVMRADSRILEVGLAETLSHLTLKPVTINRLRGKIQSEPTDIELTPVTESVTKNEDDSNEEKEPKDSFNFQLWRLYFSQDDDGDTQLHIAIVQGFHEVALSLIRMAPHPSLFDCLNNKRQSPLHLAVLTHQYIIARRLVLAGADPGLRNSDGNTALHLAAACGDIACVRALTLPVQTSERIYLVPARQAPAVPQDLEQRNYDGETCLHAAVVAGNTEVVRLLLRVGADLEAKERLGGRTALHLAIECRREGVTSLLLNECRPQLDALTYGGVTPYEIALAWNSQLAKELILLGADCENGNEDLSGKMPQLWQNVAVGLRA